ncbi:hypothetical protein FOA52_004946 [Chlamydomonas sp. UWO 241]|nr:hypothetical protein FOA52_004946 [Chlamydomonas sp. UWO 241]
MEGDEAELQTLLQFYEDLPPAVVREVWRNVNFDYKAAMEQLAEIAKNPDAVPQSRGDASASSALRPPMSSRVAEVGTEEGDRYSNPYGSATAASAYGSGAWDMSSLMNTVGQGLSDSITGLADNISDFVADLASAFDAGWDEDDETGQPGQARRPRDSAAVVTGGNDTQNAVADAAGALVVTPAEVRAAATHSKPGTAPGPDGIPVVVWRKLGEPAFELLAAVFTAVGATGGTPPGFLDGVVASIYKAKNAADAANYRPLTMLGSDYRILAKVLATRWTPLLSAVVGPEQTAFLAGRRISDNICLTQMLPGLLAANAAEGMGPTGAALALLDFRKAYDTIDRGFLIAVMEAVGVGDGVLAWTRTILTHTYASAEVNGFISAPRKYAAGVRQGCPAAPALFLFLGHALACFLRTCPAVGVEVVPGCRVTCPQYADDCMPLLRSCAPADVAALVETMAVFGRATGLVLNLGKCGILPLGSAGEGLLAGAEVAGLRVLDAGVSLGVPVSAGLPPPEGVTGVCRERLAAAYTKLARFPMSAFGRGHAAATYGVSRILFRAVHCGMTPEAERVLSRWTATLVDRSVGPDPPAELPRWASSVPAELWGAEAPLWANPLLQLELPAAQRSVQWREPTGDAAGHALFSPTDAARWLVDGLARVRDALPGMRTVTDLCVLWAWLAAVDMVFAGLRGLEAAVPTLWRMPLLNARKEPIWRLWGAEMAPATRSIERRSSGDGSNIERALIRDIVDAEDPRHLFALIEDQGNRFNAIHVSVAACRVAKLFRDRKLRRPLDLQVRHRVARLLTMARERLPVMQELALANTLWAVSQLRAAGLEEPALVDAIIRKARSQLPSFRAHALAKTAWAMATLSHTGTAFMGDLLEAAALQLRSFSSQNLADTAWAMATLGHVDAAFLGALMVVAKSKLRSFSSQNLADTAWAIATLGHKDTAFMGDLLQAIAPQLRSFSSQNLASTAWAMATLGHKDTAFMRDLLEVVAPQLHSFSSQNLANTA